MQLPKIPQSIFAHADGFLKAATLLGPDRDPACFAAMVTNTAFASELFLKCLIYLETGQLFRNQHNLRTLFLRLPDATRAAIETKFNARYQPRSYDTSQLPDSMKDRAAKVIAMQPKDFREALKDGAEAFVEWRYLYEDEGESGNCFSLFPLPEVLREEILARKPEWAGFGMRPQHLARAQSPSPAQKTPAPADPRADPAAGSR